MTKQSKTPNNIKDLRGVDCPMNFVKTKLALEEMNPGEILEVYLDPGKPIEEVPLAVKAEGHEILNIKDCATYFSLIIKK